MEIKNQFNVTLEKIKKFRPPFFVRQLIFWQSIVSLIFLVIMLVVSVSSIISGDGVALWSMVLLVTLPLTFVIIKFVLPWCDPSEDECEVS